MSQQKDIFFYIIVPIYNVENYLLECLETIVKQSYKNFHCILVNDGSTDNSLKIAQDFVARVSKRDNGANNSFSLPQFSIINKSNGGLSSARNAGVDKACRLAKSEYLNFIWFVDSDDWVPLNALEIMKNVISKYPNIDYFQANSFKICDEQTKKEEILSEYHLPKRFENKLQKPLDTLSELCIDEIKLYASVNYSFRLDFLLKNHIRFVEGVVFEDNLHALECAIKADLVYVSSDYIYVYRSNRAGSIMHTHSITNINTKNCVSRANSRYEIMLAFEKASKLSCVPEKLQKTFYEYLIRDCTRLLRVVQFIGYRNDLCFTKKDLHRFYADLPVKYKICYHIPRIYGFPKKTRLFFTYWFFKIFGK